MNFFIDHLPQLLQKIWQHVYLSGLSLLLAIFIAVPLGILIQRLPRLRGSTIGISNVLQTIPSLALLALLIPFLGIGVKPTITALVLYAILPIVRNTLAGLQEVSADIIEAADGLGFTKSQRLFLVEFPLAMPIIVAGIRISASMIIGVTTIAAFIGAGGLGDFITQGLALNNSSLILLGAIPAAILALGVDFIISRLELSKNRLKILTIICLGIFSLFLLSWWKVPHSHKPEIIVASKNFTEQIILGEIIAQTIEKKTPHKVVRKFNLGTTDIVHQALLNGEVDIYPEYSGTAYLNVLKGTARPNAEELFLRVQEGYKNKFKLIWLKPFGFSNSQSLSIKKTFASKYKLSKISQLSQFHNQLKIAAPPEFLMRADALPGLIKAYGINFAEIKQVDSTLMYLALLKGEVDVIASFTTDGRLAKNNIVVLQDDLNFYPAYEAAPVAREELLEKSPEVVEALESLAGKIDVKTMQHMNAEVDIEGKSPEKVALEFLK